jgi:hypothetical protein
MVLEMVALRSSFLTFVVSSCVAGMTLVVLMEVGHLVRHRLMHFKVTNITHQHRRLLERHIMRRMLVADFTARKA